MNSKLDDLSLYFDDLGDYQAKCKLCAKVYPFKVSVANLRHHLERNHELNSCSFASSLSTTTTTPPNQLFVTSTTLTTDDILTYSSDIKALETLSEHSDTDTQNNSQTANTESSDVEQFPKKVAAVLDELDARNGSPPRTRSIKRRVKRPSLRGALPIDTDEDFGRLISKKLNLLPLAIRCGLEVEILRMVNGALNSMDTL